MTEESELRKELEENKRRVSVLESERGRLRRKLFVYSIIFIIALGFTIGGIFLYQSIMRKESFAGTNAGPVIMKDGIPFGGACITEKPAGGNYARVVFTIKTSKPIEPRTFVWNGIDYARKCFKISDKIYTFNAYLPYIPQNEVSVFGLIRTQQPRNPIEYSFKIFDLEDHLIGQYPKDGSTITHEIVSLGEKFVIDQEIMF